jgi:hypothetical protein
MSERTCPLCGAQQTHHVHPISGGIEASFKNQYCSDAQCGLPCNLWDKIEATKAEVERLREASKDWEAKYTRFSCYGTPAYSEFSEFA